MVSPNEILALFDLDGTITNRDTFLDFHLWALGFGKTLLGLLDSRLPGIIFRSGRDAAKERIFSKYWQGKDYELFVETGKKYSVERLPILMKNQAREAISFHRQRKDKLVLVSASLHEWMEPWALDAGFSAVIATEPEVKSGTLTGLFSTPNCRGPEKVRRLREMGLPGPGAIVYAYGDSRGDRQMLELATYPVYRWRSKTPC
jgi:HAD superfamily hydrolase (TIGR01490 family)